MKANVVRHDDAVLRELGGGVSRRILAWNEHMMSVEVSFEVGGVGSAHSHPHSQNTYVLSGRFRFDIDGETVEVAAGDTLAIEPDAVHSTLCLEKGALLDVFAPMREDFLKA